MPSWQWCGNKEKYLVGWGHAPADQITVIVRLVGWYTIPWYRNTIGEFVQVYDIGMAFSLLTDRFEIHSGSAGS